MQEPIFSKYIPVQGYIFVQRIYPPRIRHPLEEHPKQERSCLLAAVQIVTRYTVCVSHQAPRSLRSLVPLFPRYLAPLFPRYLAPLLPAFQSLISSIFSTSSCSRAVIAASLISGPNSIACPTRNTILPERYQPPSASTVVQPAKGHGEHRHAASASPASRSPAGRAPARLRQSAHPRGKPARGIRDPSPCRHGQSWPGSCAAAATEKR